MRTSNKLLLAFVALVVLVMLFSNIVLWANFKKGIYHDKYLDQQKAFTNQKRSVVSLMPFKVLQLKGHHMFGVSASQTGSPFILFDGDSATNQFTWSQKNDTLFVQLLSENGITLFCSDITTILLASGCNLRVNDQLSMPHLNIRMSDSCYTELVRVKIGSLNISGGRESTVKVIESDSRIDSLKLQLGKSSSFMSYDIPYQYSSVKIDSIKTLEITGRSLSTFKEIK
jgi:hypothetical protein